MVRQPSAAELRTAAYPPGVSETRRSKRPCGSSRRWISAASSSLENERVPERLRTSRSSETSFLLGSTPGKATSTITALSVSITSTGGTQVGTREAVRAGRNTSRCKRSARSSISIAFDHIQWRGKFDPIILPAARAFKSDLKRRDADWRRMTRTTPLFRAMPGLAANLQSTQSERRDRRSKPKSPHRPA